MFLQFTAELLKLLICNLLNICSTGRIKSRISSLKRELGVYVFVTYVSSRSEDHDDSAKLSFDSKMLQLLKWPWNPMVIGRCFSQCRVASQHAELQLTQFASKLPPSSIFSRGPMPIQLHLNKETTNPNTDNAPPEEVKIKKTYII